MRETMRVFAFTLLVASVNCAGLAGALQGLGDPSTRTEHCLLLPFRESTSGSNRNCVYGCPSGEATLTIPVMRLCALSWDRSR